MLMDLFELAGFPDKNECAGAINAAETPPPETLKAVSDLKSIVSFVVTAADIDDYLINKLNHWVADYRHMKKMYPYKQLVAAIKSTERAFKNGNNIVSDIDELETRDEKTPFGCVQKIIKRCDNYVSSECLYNKIISSIEIRGFTIDNASFDSIDGNIVIKLGDKIFIRFRVSDEGITLHAPHHLSKFFYHTGSVNTVDLINEWESFSYSFDSFNETVLQSVFYAYIEFLKRNLSDSLGCCSLYRQCSDFKGCVITDTDGSRSDIRDKCYYRLNLLQGNIFYGVNSLNDLDDMERELLKAYRYADNDKKNKLFDIVVSSNAKDLDGQIRVLFDEGVKSVTDVCNDAELIKYFSSFTNRTDG